jgi:hypothetical protein
MSRFFSLFIHFTLKILLIGTILRALFFRLHFRIIFHFLFVRFMNSLHVKITKRWLNNFPILFLKAFWYKSNRVYSKYF